MRRRPLPRLPAVLVALALAALPLTVGCSPDSGAPESGGAGTARDAATEPVSGAAPPDSITRRQRDSVIGESRLPGARGVRGALEASDAAAGRNAALDSLQR